MLIKILLVLAALIAVFVIVVALRPSHFHIERSAILKAAPAEIFPHLNDLRKSHVWSPWTKVDPNATYTFEGPPSGVGASSTWSGNNQIGAGRQTITASHPNELVRIQLDFERPMKGTSTAEFLLKPQGAETMVTWTLDGENHFLAKAFCLFVDQDKMIGGPFERGLADLKSLVERGAAR